MLKPWKKSFSWLLALAVTGPFLVAPPPARAQYDRGSASDTRPTRVTGRVDSIGRSGMSFVIDTGRRHLTVVARQADVVRYDNRGRELRDPFRPDSVHVGQRVLVEGSWTDSDILRASVVRLNGIDSPDLRSDRIDRPDLRSDRGDRPDFVEARTGDSLSGRIVSPTGDLDRAFRVRVMGREVQVQTPSGARVSRDGSPISVHELSRGDRVRVRGVWIDRGQIRARRVEAFSPDWDFVRGEIRRDARPEILTGTVLRLDPKHFQLRIRTANGSFDVDATAADVMQDGRIRAFADLNEGEPVSIFVSKRRGDVIVATRIDRGARRAIIEDDTRASDTLTGSVRDIDRLNRTFRIRSDSQEILVRVPSSVDLLDADGNPITFKDLNEGDQVRVSGTHNDLSGDFTADQVEMSPE